MLCRIWDCKTVAGKYRERVRSRTECNAVLHHQQEPGFKTAQSCKLSGRLASQNSRQRLKIARTELGHLGPEFLLTQMLVGPSVKWRACCAATDMCSPRSVTTGPEAAQVTLLYQQLSWNLIMAILAKQAYSYQLQFISLTDNLFNPKPKILINSKNKILYLPASETRGWFPFQI